jgi:hypothetical protein
VYYFFSFTVMMEAGHYVDDICRLNKMDQAAMELACI